MTCKAAKKNQAVENEAVSGEASTETQAERLLFLVDSRTPSDNIPQNTLTELEWAVKNKISPDFWGRNLTGENALTKEEMELLHDSGCKIAAIYVDKEPKETEEQGRVLAKKIDVTAFVLGIPEGTAVFLEMADGEHVTRDFMKGFADGLILEGFVPGFKTNGDTTFGFDREFSRGLQTDREIFEKCMVWEMASSLKEYDRVTTAHLIHPDNRLPFAPSGMARQYIAVWQYGKDCYSII